MNNLLLLNSLHMCPTYPKHLSLLIQTKTHLVIAHFINHKSLYHCDNYNIRHWLSSILPVVVTGTKSIGCFFSPPPHSAMLKLICARTGCTSPCEATILTVTIIWLIYTSHKMKQVLEKKKKKEITGACHYIMPAGI